MDGHTTAIFPHTIEKAYPFSDAHEAEQAIHDVLDEYRVNPRREYFDCDLQTASDAIEQVCSGSYSGTDGYSSTDTWSSENVEGIWNEET